MAGTVGGLARSAGVFGPIAPGAPLPAWEVCLVLVATVVMWHGLRRAGRIRGMAFELIQGRGGVWEYGGVTHTLVPGDVTRVSRTMYLSPLPRCRIELPVLLFDSVLVLHTRTGEVYVNADGCPDLPLLADQIRSVLGVAA